MAEIIATRRTFDSKTIHVFDDGSLTDSAGRTWTLHRRQLDVSTALLVAEESALFDAAEMPSLIEAAHRLLPRSPRGVIPGALRDMAHRLSDKAGTRPGDTSHPAQRTPKAPAYVAPWGTINGITGPLYVDAWGVTRVGGQ